jgi:4-hydroxy-tetrahydrodipicolinate synthase
VALAKHLVESGSDGVVVAGTTGESPTLTKEEKLELFGCVGEALRGKATVVAGTGTNDTAGSVALTKAVGGIGVDGVMAVCPYYNKPSQEGMYRHFRAIAESTSLPLIVYNVPSRTASNLEPATLERLAAVPNVAALKEASGDMAQVADIMRRVPPGLEVYSGNDSDTYHIMALGGVGVISVASHVAGRAMKEMVEAAGAGQWDGAREIHLRLGGLFKVLFLPASTNPAPVKAALRLCGFDVGGLRLPLTECDEKGVAQIKAVLATLGLV